MSNESDAMSCEDARERISAACDGEAVRTGELASHLDTCDRCRDFAGRLGALSSRFAALREAGIPASLSARVLAPFEERLRRPELVRATALRVAAGLLGLASIGAVGAALSAKSTVGPPALEASWLEPLAGRALHPKDAQFRDWTEAMGAVVNGDRK